jgi:uncharacterized protein (TIGR00369 family)
MHDLQEWIRLGNEIQARIDGGAGYGVAPPKVAAMSGLQALRAALAGDIPASPITQVLGFQFVEVGEGRAVFQGQPRAEHANPSGTVHGGWYSSMLDSCLVTAVYSLLPVGRGYTTAQLSTNFVKGMAPGKRMVRAEANVVHCGKQMATAEGRIFDHEGTIYAHATISCMLFDFAPR